MLVSHTHQFIYTKTYKTASTSIEDYFETYCRLPETPSKEIGPHISKEGIIGYRGNSRRNAQWYNHQPASEIKEQLGAEVWNTYFKFCTVRHPLDKLVSAYFFQRKRIEKSTWNFRAKNSFRKNVLNKTDFYPDVSKEPIKGFRDWLGSGAFWDDKPVFLIDGKFALDDFIRFENLEEDLGRICEKLNLPYEPERLRHLKSNRRDTDFATRDFFSDELIKRVGELYRFELDFFGYAL